MMDLETDAKGYSNFSIEQLGELLQIAVLFLQANGLKVGLTLVTVSREGVRTIGNLSPEQQRETFQMLGDAMGDPEAQHMLGTKGAPGATH